MTTFEEFVGSRGQTLLRQAIMLTGSARAAEDLVRATFVTALQQWPRVSEDGSLEANMRGLLVTEDLSRRGRRRRRTPVPTEVMPVAPGSDAVLDDREDDSIQVVAWQVLASLPPRQRAILALRYYIELSDRQVADALGCREKAVPAEADLALATLGAAHLDMGRERTAPITIPELEDSLREVFSGHEDLADEAAPERLASEAARTCKELRRRHTLAGLAAAVVVTVGIVAVVQLHDPSATVTEAGPSPATKKRLDDALATFEASWEKAKPPQVTVFGASFPEFRGPDESNNPIELIAGGVVAKPGALSAAPPADGVIRWVDWDPAVVPVMSAVETLADVQDSSSTSLDPCPTCRPRTVTGARLTRGPLFTGKGEATIPMWEFDLAGTKTKVAMPAISSTHLLTPVMAPDTMPDLFILGAVLTDDSRELTVQFSGEDQSCPQTYSASSQHSEHAVAVLLESRGPACAVPQEEATTTRYITIQLDQPLGEATVINAQNGIPVIIER